MAANAALNATVQDLLLRTTAAEALGAQLLQQQAQIAEQAGMLGQLEQDNNAALVAHQLVDNIRYSDACHDVTGKWAWQVLAMHISIPCRPYLSY